MSYSEGIVRRNRNSRHGLQKRRRRAGENANRTNRARKMAVQFLICIAILSCLSFLKMIKAPFTNHILAAVKDTVNYRTDLKNIYQAIDMVVKKAGDTIESAKTRQTKADVAFVRPVEGVVTSSFGYRIHPVTNKNEFHNGMDIDGEYGTPIKAAVDGVVVETGEDPELGKYVKIESGNSGAGIQTESGGGTGTGSGEEAETDGGTGSVSDAESGTKSDTGTESGTGARIVTVYGHCSEILVSKGQVVSAGDVIAKVGDTGNATGPHLHFEVWLDGERVDPAEFL